jgi:NAD(P)-dependent dehydrogenase (short-subunit alcohol dehydrogenase family)
MVGRQFNAQSTAADVIEAVNLSGKLAVVTGSTGGLGKVTAAALARAGADVVIAGRNRDAVESVRMELREKDSDSAVYGLELDLQSETSIAAFAEGISALSRSVDIVVANAGIMACPLARAMNGVESQLMSNFVGHALLVSALSSAIRRADAARVVVLSSAGHQLAAVDLEDLNFQRRPYDSWIAYGQSKTACALLAVKIGSEMGASGVTALAVHPGVIKTGLMRHLNGDYVEKLEQRRTIKTAEQGAATSVWAATAPELRGRTLYLEDCSIGQEIKEPNFKSGFLSYAMDLSIARKLWCTMESLIGRSLAL